MVPSGGATENIPSDTTGNRSRDRLVAQCLNHYANPGPKLKVKASPLHAVQAEGEGRGTAIPPLDPGANNGVICQRHTLVAF